MSNNYFNSQFESVPHKYQSFVTGLIVCIGCAVFGFLQLARIGAFQNQEHYTFLKYETANVLYSRVIEAKYRLNMHIQIAFDDDTETWILARSAKYFALAGDQTCVEVKTGDETGKKIYVFSNLENC